MSYRILRRSWLNIIVLGALFLPIPAGAQIEDVIVETYYISDTLDATDTFGSTLLEEQTFTYRIYIDLKEGSKLRRIYGDKNHPLIINSSAIFYNNIDRPNAYFGYMINDSWYEDNPTLALDSWITIGLATKDHKGGLKESDSDGSLLENNGGTAEIPVGILINDDPRAGIPITEADGLLPNDSVLGQWLDHGFINFSGDDTTIFGPSKVGSRFISRNVFLQQNEGVVGADPVVNRVLIAQLTTQGDLSFEINLEVEEPDGIGTKIVKYVANDSALLGDEIICPFLKYPPECGCLDPNYLEYSNAYACNEQDSCITPVVLGCMDTLACNYSPDVNFHIPQLCCYIGYCNDRDISIVCEDYLQNRLAFFDFKLYPNPAEDQLNFQFNTKDEHVVYKVHDAIGRTIIHRDLGSLSGNSSGKIDLSNFENGFYLLELSIGETKIIKKFTKR